VVNFWILIPTGFTHVISAVGNALMLLQPAMIEAAIEGGVKHFYASEWNSDIDQREIHNWRYFRDKQAVRSYLRAKATQFPGFQFTLMITGIFTEWAVIDLYGFDHSAHTARIYGKPENRVGVTSIPDAARYTVDSLRIPFNGNTQGRVLRVQGWTGAFQDLVAEMEKAKGVKYTITYAEAEEVAAKQEEARVAGEDWPQMKYSIMPLVASGYGVADGVGELDNHLFDFVPETSAQTFARVFGK
jgi:NmrA-like family